MGYGVYWMNKRWQGYSVPAPCDFIGCDKIIDRGLGYKHSDDDVEAPCIFTCEDHSNKQIQNFEINLKKESQEWIKHVLNDDSWKRWRDENPEIVKKYEQLGTPQRSKK